MSDSLRKSYVVGRYYFTTLFKQLAEESFLGDIAQKPYFEEGNFEYALGDFTSEEMLNRGIDTLPADLYGSLRALAKDELMKDVLGEATYKKYYDIKMKEWDDFRIHVSDWERERYLGVY